MDDPNPIPLSVIEFGANNAHVKIGREDEQLTIDTPWGFDDAQFSFPIKDTDALNELRQLLLVPQLDALLHLDSNEAEFIFAFLNPEEPKPAGYLDRSFKFHFQNHSYECSYRQPTARLFAISKYFRRLPSAGSLRAGVQLIQFRDSQNVENLPPAAKKYFETRVPRSFFVKPSIPIREVDWESLSRHLNLLMVYYDRSSPRIVYRQKNEVDQNVEVESLRYVEGRFPPELVFSPADDILLRLIEVSRASEVRFGFIYCYQVFEYAGFYFVEAKTKGALSRLLRSPSFIGRVEERLPDLIGLLTDSAQTDDVRIRKVIEEYCDPRSLWREIEQHKEFFSNDLIFEGGFTLPKMISKDMTEESWCTMWMPKLIDQITKVRNCLVHAREKRESRVIMPTPQNDAKIAKLMPLVLRMAEQIVLHGDKE